MTSPPHEDLPIPRFRHSLRVLIGICLFAVAARIHLGIAQGPNAAYWQLPESPWRTFWFGVVAVAFSIAAAVIGLKWINRPSAVLLATAVGGLSTAAHNGVFGAAMGCVIGLLIAWHFARIATWWLIQALLATIAGIVGGALALWLDPDLSDGPCLATCAALVVWLALLAVGRRRFRRENTRGSRWSRWLANLSLLIFVGFGGWLSLSVDLYRRVYRLDDGQVERDPDIYWALPPHQVGVRDTSYTWLWPGPLCVRGLTINSRATDDDLFMLRGWTDLFELSIASEQISDAGLAHLTELKSLNTLELRSPRVTDAGLAHISWLTALRTLSLRRAHVSRDGLARLSALPMLRQLSLADGPTSDEDLAVLRRLPAIEIFDLSGTRITDQGLSQLPLIWRLADLDLARTRITGDGLPSLRRFTLLGRLDLSDTELTNEGLRNLRGLSVRTVALDDTSITDQELAGLESICLHGLSLRRTKISDAAIEHLQRQKFLGRLDLDGTNVTEAGKTRLRELLPMCKIE
ncbi:MAG TPA: hypothetical protein VJ783_22605 [Pirellulales bacterium]|nr:hypothetical protein [Pirellulales bacterium]